MELGGGRTQEEDDRLGVADRLGAGRRTSRDCVDQNGGDTHVVKLDGERPRVEQRMLAAVT